MESHIGKIFLFNVETQRNKTKLNFNLIANSFKIQICFPLPYKIATMHCSWITSTDNSNPITC